MKKQRTAPSPSGMIAEEEHLEREKRIRNVQMYINIKKLI